MRLALPDNRIEIAIEDESKDEKTAYVQISTDGKVSVQGAAGETREIALDSDLNLD